MEVEWHVMSPDDRRQYEAAADANTAQRQAAASGNVSQLNDAVGVCGYARQEVRKI